MRYCVTGATGFVGGEVTRQLIAAGHEVVAVVRSPEKAQALADLGVTVHQGDVTEKESLRAPMTGADGLFHIAGWYKIGLRDKSPGMAVNVNGTRNTLEMMRELDIPKGVYTSTIGINSNTHGKIVDETYRYSGPFQSEYERTKWMAHYTVAEPMIAEGLPLIIVMPGLIYGPGDTSSVRQMWIDYLHGKLAALPRGTTFSWAHVEDVARGHILAMEKGTVGQTYIVAGPSHTLADAMVVAEKTTGVPAPRLISPGILRTLAPVVGIFEKVFPVPTNFRAESLRTIAGTTIAASAAKAHRELGYAPRTLEEGLRDTLRNEMRLLGMEVPAES